MTDSDVKWILIAAILISLTIIVGVSFDNVSRTWKDVELAKLRCAPSAAPSGSAP